jgi:hypothetical protein
MAPSFTALAVEAFARGLVSGGATRADLAAVASAIARTCIAQDLCAIGSEHLLKPPAGTAHEALTPETRSQSLVRSQPPEARTQPLVVQAPGLSDIHGPHGIVSSSTEVQQEHQGASSDLVAKLGAFYLHFNKELFPTAAERVAKNKGDPVLINASFGLAMVLICLT